jgi:putative ABC transport system ATP-binding protein
MFVFKKIFFPREFMETIIELQNVEKDFPLGRVTVRALRDVSLSIEKGEFTAIAGPSGSGKTTMLNLIGCIDVPTRGSVLVDGHKTSTMNDRELTDLRLHKLGFIFQSFNLVPVLTMFQNIELPLLLQGGLTKGEREKRVHELVDRVGLMSHIKHRPLELSGGQRQRVAIARALVTRPRIVLADEPTANLDSKTGENIIDLMREMHRKDQTTFIFSTHDPKVMRLAERVVRMVDGEIAGDERGEPDNTSTAA